LAKLHRADETRRFEVTPDRRARKTTFDQMAPESAIWWLADG